MKNRVKKLFVTMLVLNVLIVAGGGIKVQAMSKMCDASWDTTGGTYPNNSYFSNNCNITQSSGFEYGVTPNGGDLNRAKTCAISSYNSTDYYGMAWVKDPNGTTKHGASVIGNHGGCSTAQIGALRGTDYNSYNSYKD